MFIAAEQNLNSKLIVLMPEALAGDLELSRSVARYARFKVSEVIYLVALESPFASLQVTRSMVTMKAMTSDRQLAVSFQLVNRSNFARLVKKVCSSRSIAIIPQASSIQSGTFDFIPVRSSDWFWLSNALFFSKDIIGGFHHSSSR